MCARPSAHSQTRRSCGLQNFPWEMSYCSGRGWIKVQWQVTFTFRQVGSGVRQTTLEKLPVIFEKRIGDHREGCVQRLQST